MSERRAAWWAIPFRIVLIGPLVMVAKLGAWADDASRALARRLP